MGSRINRNIARGDTLPFRLVLQSDEAGQPWQSFADYRLTFTLKTDPALPDSSAIVQLHSGVGGGIAAGVTAIWRIETEGLIPGSTYHYDVQLQRLSTGVIVTLEVGTITVLPDVTHSIQPQP